MRLLLFLLAFITRCLVGYIFYGSIDVTAFLGINAHTFNNMLVLHPFSIWCAFPVIPYYLWLCGLLSIKTQLPLAFCFKIIPILFDSLLAVLIYDIIKKTLPARALLGGLLYTLSPIAIIITCIHGQWDALPILFFLLSFFIRDYYQDSFKKYFLYGALFSFSFLLKPLALVFLPFFFVPWPALKKTLGIWWTYLWVTLSGLLFLLASFFIFFKLNKNYSIDSLLSPQLFLIIILLGLIKFIIIWVYKPWRLFSYDFQKYLGYQLTSIFGLLAMTATCFLFLGLYGFNLIKVIDKVLRYCNQGIAVFGLPFGYPFNTGILNLILKNRFWIMGLITGISVLYYKNQLSSFQAILASLMIIFSFSGLSPQYLLWAVPFLLITNHYKLLALFNLVCSIFFIFYYMNPFSNPEVLYQSMLSFAPLKNFSWLLPPAFLTQEAFMPLVNILGNYIIPGICFATACLVLARSKPVITRHLAPLGKNIYIFIMLGLTVLIALLMVFTDKTNFSGQFKTVIASKMAWYDTCVINGFVSGCYSNFYIFNITTLIILGALIWSIIAWRASKHD